MKIIKLKGNFPWAGRRPTRRMCALILNAIWPLTNNAVKGEAGGCPAAAGDLRAHTKNYITYTPPWFRFSFLGF